MFISYVNVYWRVTNLWCRFPDFHQTIIIFWWFPSLSSIWFIYQVNHIYIYTIYIPNISRWNPHLPGWLSSLKRRSQGDLWGCWFWDVRAPGCCLQRIHGFFNGTYLQSGIIKQERWDSSILFFFLMLVKSFISQRSQWGASFATHVFSKLATGFSGRFRELMGIHQRHRDKPGVFEPAINFTYSPSGIDDFTWMS